MQIPFVPTDSLYKFLAISGLVIIVLSVVGPWSRYEQLVSKNIEMQIRDLAFDTKEASIESEMKELDKRLKKVKTQKEVESVLSRLGELRKQLEELRAATPELAEKRVWNKYLMETTAIFIKAGTYGFALGVLLSIIGFVLWYKKVQFYQDGILKQQYKDVIESKPPITPKE